MMKDGSPVKIDFVFFPAGHKPHATPNRNVNKMGTDGDTTLTELKQLISHFVEERDWLQYHDPKNLVMALMSEVGELADQFRWVDNTASQAFASSPDHAEEVADELADVMMFAIEFASVCNIDISSAIASKLDKNATRYPVEKAKGSCKKYDRL